MPKQPHQSFGFYTESEYRFLNQACPLKYKDKITKIKRRAAGRKAAFTKYQKAQEESQ